MQIKQLLKKYNVRPSKRLGQNFLNDKRTLQKIVEAAELKPDDVVLEIGPGLGNLTTELAKKAKKVIAVEKDENLVKILKDLLGGLNIRNVEIIHGDILKIFDLTSPKIVANIPYYLTSPLIRKFLEAKNPPEFMVLLIQKEVAQRITARPPDTTRSAGSGSSRASRGMNLLAVSVQFYAEPKIIAYVSKKCFLPSPKVDSAIIKITPFKDDGRASPRQLFFKIVKAAFSQPRKQLLNNLSGGLKLNKREITRWLLENNIQPSQRAETLSVDDWIKLTKSYKIKK